MGVQHQNYHLKTHLGALSYSTDLRSQTINVVYTFLVGNPQKQPLVMSGALLFFFFYLNWNHFSYLIHESAPRVGSLSSCKLKLAISSKHLPNDPKSSWGKSEWRQIKHPLTLGRGRQKLISKQTFHDLTSDIKILSQNSSNMKTKTIWLLKKSS